MKEKQIRDPTVSIKPDTYLAMRPNAISVDGTIAACMCVWRRNATASLTTAGPSPWF